MIHFCIGSTLTSQRLCFLANSKESFYRNCRVKFGFFVHKLVYIRGNVFIIPVQLKNIQPMITVYCTKLFSRCATVSWACSIKHYWIQTHFISKRDHWNVHITPTLECVKIKQTYRIQWQRSFWRFWFSPEVWCPGNSLSSVPTRPLALRLYSGADT